MKAQKMFPLNVQAKLAKLHIAQYAGKQANEISNQISSQINELKKQTEQTVIRASQTLETLRINNTNSLIEQLQNVSKEETQKLNSLHSEVFNYQWDYNSQEVGNAYESIIEEANQEGADIYNATVTLLHKYSYEELDEAIERSVEMAEARNIKLKVRCEDLFNPVKKREPLSPRSVVGKVVFYTTTKGARFISKIINSICYWDHISTETKYYAMSMTSPTINEIMKGEVSERRDDTLDLFALVSVNARKIGFEGEMVEVGRIITRNSKSHVNNERYNFVFSDDSDKPFFPLDEFKELSESLELSEATKKAYTEY